MKRRGWDHSFLLISCLQVWTKAFAFHWSMVFLSIITWPIQACLLAGCLSRQLVQQEDDVRGKTIFINICTSTTNNYHFLELVLIYKSFLQAFETFWFPNDAQCLSYLLQGARSYTSFQINQCFGSVLIWYGYGSGYGLSILGWIRIQDFDDQQLKKIYSLKRYIFFDQKLQFTCPKASLKDVQATKEAFSPQKRTSSASKHEIS